MEQQILEIEKSDGIRLPYNILPMKPVDHLPVSVMYNPFTPCPLIGDEPAFCLQCRAIINPYCEINKSTNLWTCIFCQKANAIKNRNFNQARNIQSANVNDMTAEIDLTSTSVEYTLNRASPPTLHIFVVDTCYFDSLRQALFLDAVSTAFDLLPENSLVCFITFGTNINLIDYGDKKRVYCFSGSKKYSLNELNSIFEKDCDKVVGGLKNQGFLIKKFFKRKIDYPKDGSSLNGHSAPNNVPPTDLNSISNPLGHGNNSFNSAQETDDPYVSSFKPIHSPLDLSFLQKDPFPVLTGMRPLRCTGSALSFATSLANSVENASKIFLFTQGPCTYGPGAICSLYLKDPVRSFCDILKGTASFCKPASNFYKELAKELTNCSLNVFAATIEDIGMFEINFAVSSSGGSVVMAQDFCRKVLLSSIIKYLKAPNTDYSTLPEKRSYYTTVYEALETLKQKKRQKSQINNGQDSEIPGNSQLQTGDSSAQTTDISPFTMPNEESQFTISNKHTTEFTFNTKSAILQTPPQELRSDVRLRIQTSPNIKLKTILGPGTGTTALWRIPTASPRTCVSLIFEILNDGIAYIQITATSQYNKKLKSKVTTIARATTTDIDKIAQGFDIEAAVSLQAKMLCSGPLEEDMDIVRRIDRSLIRFVRKYATFSRNDPASVKLPDQMAFLPNLLYFLRRSTIAQVALVSPDESAYHRNLVSAFSVKECLSLLCPTLICYSYKDGVFPVLLDSKSLEPENILMLDTFTHVVIWKGSVFRDWINSNLHLQTEYQILNELIQACLQSAKDTVLARYPTPKFVVTEHGESQERLVLSRVNPDKAGACISTDDIDYDTFYRCLCKIVVEA